MDCEIAKQNEERDCVMKMTEKKVYEHTFVICAYKESMYLEKCIESLKNQTIPSEMLITTSTPNAYIDEVAQKYGIKVCVRGESSDIALDWQYGYDMASTPYVTIAHQDDIYLPTYTQSVLSAFSREKQPLIYFSDYAELREEKVVTRNQLLWIKRMMLVPLRFRLFFSSRFIRRRILSLGSPICCPSVAYAKNNLPKTIFVSGFRSNEDWEAWEKLSRLKGQFIYDSKIRMYHRIHQESETSAIIKDNKRSEEDLHMYSKFWPMPIAKLLVRLYSNGQKSNDLN